MTAQIFLIRHGETAWSLTGQHTGNTDLPLTAKGEADAGQLRERLKSVAFSHVLTSPRQRARRTCELAGHGATALIEPELREWDYGTYEGLTRAEIHTRQPGWNVFHHGAPGGESVEDVSARADRVVAQLRQLGGNIAVFSHGHFLRALAVRWIGLPLSEARHFLLDTTSLSILSYENAVSPQPVISLWNFHCPAP